MTGKKIWTYVSDFLLGLGASTILTDAILHLIPHGLDLHGHGDSGDHAHSHGAEEESNEHADKVADITWKLTFILFAFYILWFYRVLT